MTTTRMSGYESLVRPTLLRLGHGDAEAVHEWTLRRLARLCGHPWALAALRRRFLVSAPVEVFGLRLANPVGLAAGMDKDGVALAAWPALGFGFVEVGTVTWHAQPGNDRPRLFRLPASRALINRMGFNNAGASALARRLAAHRDPAGRRVGRLPAGQVRVPIGVSLGKSKITSSAEAVGDYLSSLEVLYPHGDYFVVNVSSPNTPGLRNLQDRKALDELLAAVTARAAALATSAERTRAKPIVVKIAPDLADPAIVDVLEVCLARGAAGVIATNTTLSRHGLAEADQALGAQPGGLSGQPLTNRARDVVAFVHRETNGRLPIIGVGGIVTPDDAARLMDAGASAVQLYSGLVYQGPGLVRGCARAIGRRGRAGG